MLYLLQPFKLVLGFLSIISWILWVTLGDPDFKIPAAAVATFGFLYLFHLSQYLFWGVGVLALLREKVPARFYAYYFHALALGLTWLVVVLVAMIRPRGAWIPTRHTARVEIDERLALKTEGVGSAP